MSVLVGKKAPHFEADAVVNGEEIVEKFSLSQYIGKKHVVFFFYPLDFSLVSPTEILAFQDNIEEFNSRNVAVVGCSVDSAHSHHAWLQIDREVGGIKGVTYPLVSDLSKTITENYDMLAGTYEYDEEDDRYDFDGNPVAYPGLFIIDKQGIVRHQIINDLPLGRSINEVLRMVDALQYYEESGEETPANWSK
ncbi:MAG TPA: peroxiredoxin [Lentimicrobium sp.]|nr:peroxiredoxin [Lentimicrobium sp.]